MEEKHPMLVSVLFQCNGFVYMQTVNCHWECGSQGALLDEDTLTYTKLGKIGIVSDGVIEASFSGSNSCSFSSRKTMDFLTILRKNTVIETHIHEILR